MTAALPDWGWCKFAVYCNSTSKPLLQVQHLRTVRRRPGYLQCCYGHDSDAECTCEPAELQFLKEEVHELGVQLNLGHEQESVDARWARDLHRVYIKHCMLFVATERALPDPGAAWLCQPPALDVGKQHMLSVVLLISSTHQMQQPASLCSRHQGQRLIN